MPRLKKENEKIYKGIGKNRKVSLTIDNQMQINNINDSLSNIYTVRI